VAPPLQPYIKLPLNSDSAIDVDDSLYNFLSPQLPMTMPPSNQATTTAASIDNVSDKSPDFGSVVDGSFNNSPVHDAIDEVLVSIDCSTGKNNLDLMNMPLSAIAEEVLNSLHNDDEDDMDTLAADEHTSSLKEDKVPEPRSSPTNSSTEEGTTEFKVDLVTSSSAEAAEAATGAESCNSAMTDTVADEVVVKVEYTVEEKKEPNPTPPSHPVMNINRVASDSALIKQSEPFSELPLPPAAKPSLHHAASTSVLELSSSHHHHASLTAANLSNSNFAPEPPVKPAAQQAPARSASSNTLFSEVPEWYQKGLRVELLLQAAESVNWLQDSGVSASALPSAEAIRSTISSMTTTDVNPRRVMQRNDRTGPRISPPQSSRPNNAAMSMRDAATAKSSYSQYVQEDLSLEDDRMIFNQLYNNPIGGFDAFDTHDYDLNFVSSMEGDSLWPDDSFHENSNQQFTSSSSSPSKIVRNASSSSADVANIYRTHSIAELNQSMDDAPGDDMWLDDIDPDYANVDDMMDDMMIDHYMDSLASNRSSVVKGNRSGSTSSGSTASARSKLTGNTNKATSDSEKLLLHIPLTSIQKRKSPSKTKLKSSSASAASPLP
jgi:hypothetical protein